ncbi:MAG: ATP-grasp fold amidoligase family protein [Clostridiaceae bacterium]|nr:ATP-grasp fold amidoligase family protein [Clostridiaceae bacterium]
MTIDELKSEFGLIKLYRLYRQEKRRQKNDRLDDLEFIKSKFFTSFNREINLGSPETFNEKLQWLKLYYRNPLYTRLVDKYEVKQYVAQRIGEEYLIPTLGVYERFEDIDFDSLPDSFVLKCTHDSGGLVIVKDKSKFDKKNARQIIKASLKRNFYLQSREWPYKNVKPRIIAESYMEDSKTAELRDYKFFCFDGEVKAMFIATERQKQGEDVKFDFFDADFNHLPFRQGHDHASVTPEKPVCFDEMKKLAGELSKGFPEARIDFYEVDGRIYFGEFTFFHFGGFMPFEPEEWDYKFGEWITLPKRMLSE